MTLSSEILVKEKSEHGGGLPVTVGLDQHPADKQASLLSLAFLTLHVLLMYDEESQRWSTKKPFQDSHLNIISRCTTHKELLPCSGMIPGVKALAGLKKKGRTEAHYACSIQCELCSHTKIHV